MTAQSAVSEVAFHMSFNVFFPVGSFSRLTIHMDEELRGLAFTTLQALMVDFPEWREDVLSGFAYFIVREVTDVHPTLLDNAVKMLLQLISQWRQAVQSSNKSHDMQVGRTSFSCILS